MASAQIITSARAAAAAASVRDLGVAAQQMLQSVPIWQRIPHSVELVPQSGEAIAATFDELAHTFAWVDDGLCGRRGALGAFRANQRAGIGLSPADREAAAAVALVARPHLAGTRWQYHIATAMQPIGAHEPVILDALLADAPVPLSTWAEHLGKSASQVHWQSAYPAFDLGMLPGRMRLAGEDAARSWQHVAGHAPSNDAAVGFARIATPGG